MKPWIPLTAWLLFPGTVAAQVWTFQSFAPDGSPWELSSFELTRSGRGDYTGRYRISVAQPCVADAMKATVTREGDHQVITLAPARRECPETRLVVKTDGSGGRREVREPDGSWKWDGRDRGLQRR